MTRSTIVCSLAATLAAVSLAGCQSDVSFASVRGSLTPELRGVNDTPNEADSWSTIMQAMELRMLNDDWNRAWYWDHAPKLDPRPIIYVSGNTP